MAAHTKVKSRSNNQFILLILLLAIGLLLNACLSSCVAEGQQDNKGLKAGDPLPHFAVTLNDGREVTTESLRGKRVLIELFNTGCGDCRESLPVINALYESLKDNSGMEIFAIARAEEAPQLSLYWEENGFTLPYSPQPDRKMYELFASIGIPRIYIADTSGIITATFGPDDRPTLSQLTELLTSE